MSSAHSPTCGKSSLTSIPLSPYFLNVNGDFSSVPVFRSVATVAARQRLPVVLVEHRLRIEAVDLREPAVHVQKDDALGARRVVERARAVDGLTVDEARGRRATADQAREREHAEAVADLAEGVAARDGTRAFVRHRIN